MKTGISMTIDEDVWRRSRAIAILNGMTISSVVEDFLREWSGMEGPTSGDTEDRAASGDLGEDSTTGIRSGEDGDEDR
jgi:hypothetical protein